MGTNGLAVRDINAYLDKNDPVTIDFCSGISKRELSIKYNKSMRAIDAHLSRHRINNDTKKALDNKELIIERLKNGVTFNDIAKELGIYFNHLNKALKIIGINGHIWQKLRAEGKSGKPLIKEDIEKLYLIDKLPTIEIAKIYGFVGDDAIRRFMKKNNIRIRLDGEGNMKHANPQWLMEKLNYEYLKIEYIDNKKSSLDIADELGCNAELVQRRLKRFNIPRRDPIEYQSVRKPSRIHSNIVMKYFDEHNIKHNTFIYRGVYDHKNRIFEIDEYLPEYKCFIEIQGEHWHGLKRRHWCFKRVRSKMWSDLIKYLCVTRDYPDHKFIYLSEAEVKDGKWIYKIFPQKNTSTIFVKQDYEFKICTRQEIKNFIIKHHYLQHMSNGRYYGLYDKSKLVAAAVVSVPTRNEIKLSNDKSCMELSRLVAEDLPKNGLSFFLGKLLKTERKLGVNGIVSFADVSPVMKGQHLGSIYKATNFKFVQMTNWNYRYVDLNGKVHHKKAIYNKAILNNMTEKKYARINKLYKIPEWPKLKFEYIFN